MLPIVKILMAVVVILTSHDTIIVEEEQAEEVMLELETAELPEPFRYSLTSVYGTYIYIDSTIPILLVGDSRTVGLQLTTRCEDICYISKGSMGYNWLVNGTPDYNPDELIENYLAACPNAYVILNLGVNDVHNKQNYAVWINNLAWSHPEANIYYLSVNPILFNDSFDCLVTDFNNYVKNHISEKVTWIDSNSYLKQVGFYASDGVHYDAVTNQKILDFILQSLIPQNQTSYANIE